MAEKVRAFLRKIHPRSARGCGDVHSIRDHFPRTRTVRALVTANGLEEEYAMCGVVFGEPS